MEFLVFVAIFFIIGYTIQFLYYRKTKKIQKKRLALLHDVQELDKNLCRKKLLVREYDNITDLKSKLFQYKNKKIDDLYFEGDLVDPYGISVPLKELYSSTLVMGGVGSGKTSSSGMLISKYLLSQGAGGLVLTYKTGEAEDWKQRVVDAGVDPDNVYVFNHNSGLQCDFLQYEVIRPSENAGDITNLLDILKNVGRLSKGLDVTQESRGGDNEFWEQSALNLLRNVITVLQIAFDEVSLHHIATIVDELEWGPLHEQSDKRLSKSYLFRVYKSIQKFENDVTPSVNAVGRELRPSEKRDFARAWNDLTEIFPNRPERTRGSITNQAAQMYAPLMSGKMRDMFASGTVDVYPELVFEGKVIILDISLQTYGEAGRVAQGIWKYLFQKAVERRPEHDRRPCFLWVDEAHYFLNELDQRFLTTVRSKHCATVFLTQNIDNFYTAIGERPADSLLANFKTQIFHRNDSYATNKYASDLIGQYWHKQRNMSEGETKNRSETDGYSLSMTEGTNESRSRSYSRSSSVTGSSSTEGGTSTSSAFSTSRSRSTTTGSSLSETFGSNQSVSASKGVSYSEGYTEVREYIFQPDDFKSLSDSYGNIEGVVYFGGREFEVGRPYIKALFYDPKIAAIEIEEDYIEFNRKNPRLLEETSKLQNKLDVKKIELSKIIAIEKKREETNPFKKK